VQFSLT